MMRVSVVAFVLAWSSLSLGDPGGSNGPQSANVVRWDSSLVASANAHPRAGRQVLLTTVDQLDYKGRLVGVNDSLILLWTGAQPRLDLSDTANVLPFRSTQVEQVELLGGANFWKGFAYGASPWLCSAAILAVTDPVSENIIPPAGVALASAMLIGTAAGVVGGIHGASKNRAVLGDTVRFRAAVPFWSRYAEFRTPPESLLRMATAEPAVPRGFQRAAVPTLQGGEMSLGVTAVSAFGAVTGDLGQSLTESGYGSSPTSSSRLLSWSATVDYRIARRWGVGIVYARYPRSRAESASRATERIYGHSLGFLVEYVVRQRFTTSPSRWQVNAAAGLCQPELHVELRPAGASGFGWATNSPGLHLRCVADYYLIKGVSFAAATNLRLLPDVKITQPDSRSGFSGKLFVSYLDLTAGVRFHLL
jgi:hypothetical protein